jgi:hypothetical protein
MAGRIDYYVGVRWATIAVAAAAAVGAATVPIVTGGSGGGGDTANIWVDPAATTGCTDNASEGSYNAAQDCTWDQANDTCEAGDTVLVRGGSYGNVTLTGSNSRSSACVMTVVEDATATMGQFNNGEWNGPDTGADWLTIDGGRPCKAETVSCGVYTTEFDSDNTTDVTIVGWEIDGQDDVLQLFHFDPVVNFTVRDSHIHNACAAGTTGAMTYMSDGPITIDNSDFHDANVCSGDEPHTECLFAQSVSEITFTRNRVYRCNAQGMFFTGSGNPSGLIENNYFGRTCDDVDTSCDDPHLAPNALHFRNGGEPSPSPDDMDIRYNTFRGNLSLTNSENAPTANGLRVTGNVFLAGVPCSLSNTTYSYNAHISSSCGGTGTITNASLLSNSFVDPSDFAADGGDWNLLTGSPLKNAGNTGSFPTLDLAGATRYDGSAPDIGAYEFQE